MESSFSFPFIDAANNAKLMFQRFWKLETGVHGREEETVQSMASLQEEDQDGSSAAVMSTKWSFQVRVEALEIS